MKTRSTIRWVLILLLIAFVPIVSSFGNSRAPRPPGVAPKADRAIRWSERVRQLQEYKDAFGDCLVPKRYKENPSLGNWVNKQRQLYRKSREGNKTSLTEKRIDVLNRMGFIWDASKAKTSQSSRAERMWWRRFDELSHYAQEHGNFIVHSNTSLGFWIINQRKEFILWEKGENSTMTKERVDALNTIKFDWKPRQQQVWDDRIRELQLYKEKHGDCAVPISYKENPKLAHWVANQRKNYNLCRARLTDERIEELESLGFVWDYWEYEFEKKRAPARNGEWLGS